MLFWGTFEYGQEKDLNPAVPINRSKDNVSIVKKTLQVDWLVSIWRSL